MSDVFFTQKDLARRWGISHRTLERWRWLGTGQRYLKVGARVSYRLSDIKSYEEARIRDAGPTACARSNVRVCE